MGHGAAAKKMAATALERIENLETNTGQLFEALGKTFTTVENRFHGVEELLAAVVSAVGPESVEKALEEARMEAAINQAIEAKKHIGQALERGDIVVADVVSKASIVVGDEVTSEGKAIGYTDGRVQLFITRLLPEIRDQLLGKPVGTVIETPAKGKFTVVAIYDVIDKPAVATTPNGASDHTSGLVVTE